MPLLQSTPVTRSPSQPVPARDPPDCSLFVPSGAPTDSWAGCPLHVQPAQGTVGAETQDAPGSSPEPWEGPDPLRSAQRHHRDCRSASCTPTSLIPQEAAPPRLQLLLSSLSDEIRSSLPCTLPSGQHSTGHLKHSFRKVSNYTLTWNPHGTSSACIQTDRSETLHPRESLTGNCLLCWPLGALSPLWGRGTGWVAGK